MSIFISTMLSFQERIYLHKTGGQANVIVWFGLIHYSAFSAVKAICSTR